MQVSNLKKGRPVCSSFLRRAARTLSVGKPIANVALMMSSSMRGSSSRSVMVVWGLAAELALVMG